MTGTGEWLLAHAGLINISKPQDTSMRGDEIDLRAAVLTIESEAASAERARIRERVEGLTAHIVGGYEADCDTCIRWSEELQTDVDERGIPCDLFDDGGVLNRAVVLAAIEGADHD